MTIFVCDKVSRLLRSTIIRVTAEKSSVKAVRWIAAEAIVDQKSARRRRSRFPEIKRSLDFPYRGLTEQMRLTKFAENDARCLRAQEENQARTSAGTLSISREAALASSPGN